MTEELIANDRIVPRLKVNSKKHKVRLEFTATETGSTFSCKLDKKPAGACDSPRTSDRTAPIFSRAGL